MKIEYNIPQLSSLVIHDEGFIRPPKGILTCWYDDCGIATDLQLKNNKTNLDIVKSRISNFAYHRLVELRKKHEKALQEIESVMQNFRDDPDDWIENYRVKAKKKAKV